MSRFATLAVVVLVACSGRAQAPTGPSRGAPAPALAPASGLVPGRVLARFRPGADAAAVAALHGARPEGPLALGIRVLRVPVGSERSVAAALAADPAVELAAPDWLRTLDDPTCPGCALPGDSLFGYKWDLHNDGTVTSSSGTDLATTGKPDADVDWLEAFDRLGPGFAGTARIAILDTGVRASHQDLTGKVVDQYDFANDDPDASDDQGHGTHVAGIAAARGGDGVGLTGVAYGSGIGILAAKVCRPTFFGLNAECPSSAIIAGLTWAVDHGANAINLSLGGADSSSAERAAFAYARDHDVLPFCAAGNEGTGTVLFPAAYPECVAVSATDWGDDLASYSNWGPEVLLAAPGGDSEDPSGYSQIASTCFGSDTDYCLKAGTSMAAPQATGLAGLLYALGETSADAVLQRMEDTADDLGDPGVDQRFGYGRINVDRAIDGLSGVGPPNAAPVADFTAGCADLVCDFVDASADPDGSIVAWAWTFGDGATASGPTPTHAYSCAGAYTVTLTVTDDRGATARASKTVSPTASSAGEAPFTVPGLVLWLRADAVPDVADGDPVARWPDRSGQCHDATQPEAARRPVWRATAAHGRPALEFDAADDGMATAADPGAESTLVVVYASRAGASGKALSGGYGLFMGPYVGRYRNYTGAYGNGPKVEAGRWVVQTLRQTGGRAELWIDGTPEATAKKTADPGPLILGRQGAYSDELDGSVAEVLAYDRALSDAELAAIQAALVEAYVPPPDANRPPTADFTWSCADLACSFADASADPDGSVVAWRWDFGDGTTATGPGPSHAFPGSGTWTVRLEVTDDGGATAAAVHDVTVTEPAPGPFVDPSSVPGLRLWLDAASITGLADGDPVAVWPDRSGAGADATQATAGKRPVWRATAESGRPAVEFDAVDDGLGTPVDPGADLTILVVYASRAGATGQAVSGGFRLFMGPYVGLYRNYTGAYANGPAVTAGRWLLQTLRQSGAGAELFVDGVFQAATTATADPTPLVLGKQGTYSGTLDGRVAEVLVYDRTLTDAELGDVEAWLKARHDIP